MQVILRVMDTAVFAYSGVSTSKGYCVIQLQECLVAAGYGHSEGERRGPIDGITYVKLIPHEMIGR